MKEGAGGGMQGASFSPKNTLPPSLQKYSKYLKKNRLYLVDTCVFRIFVVQKGWETEASEPLDHRTFGRVQGKS